MKDDPRVWVNGQDLSRYVRSVSIETEGMARSMRRMRRSAQSSLDALRLFQHGLVAELRREWDPDMAPYLLTDEQIEELEMRALGRTLEEIDEL